MSCYLRQMHSLFDTIGLEYDKPNRKRVDAAIREILGTPAEAHCPEVWAAIKSLPQYDRDALPAGGAEKLAL